MSVAGGKIRCFCSAKRCSSFWYHALWHRLFGRICTASRSRRAPAGQAAHAADRAQTCDVADPDHAAHPQDDLLFPLDPEAWPRHRVVGQSLWVRATSTKL